MRMMRIDQDVRSKVERKPMQHKQSGKQDFDAIVRTKSDFLKKNDLQQMVRDITEQGKKVVRFRSFRDLARFKRKIQEFLEEAVFDGLSVKQTHNFNPTNFSHRLITVEKIDEKLVELTEDLLDQESKAVDLLAIIGEIEGLLVNLYT